MSSRVLAKSQICKIVHEVVNAQLGHLPLSTILPNRFFPLRKFLVEQFHRRLRNWNWHSRMAWLAPLLTATSTPGFSRASRRCLRRRLAYTVGSMVDSMPGLIGSRLFGSPAFAIFLWTERGLQLRHKRQTKSKTRKQ